MSHPKIHASDAVALMRMRLLADDALTAVVGDRIRVEHVRDPAELQYPILILATETGSGRYHGGLQQLRVDLYAYSNESQSDAVRIYDLAYPVLQSQRLHDPSGYIRAAGATQEMERPQSGYNPRTMAWFAKGTWLVTLAGGR